MFKNNRLRLESLEPRLQLSTTTTLIPQGDVWKYLDDGSDQGTAWRDETFDDFAWESGPAQLGYGDGDEATVVSFGPNSNNKFVTTYFRNSFEVSDLSDLVALNLNLLADDGAIAYLNGVEILPRLRMPSGTVNYLTNASSVAGGSAEQTFNTFSVDTSLLQLGTNTFAVEVHQANPTSSDISFDLSLNAIIDDGTNNGTPRDPFESGVITGTVSSPKIDEASGLVASLRNPGVLWTHNDSGDTATLYALNTQGDLLGEFNIAGATNIDWEDIAIGPGPVVGVNYLYVGDIGDNPGNRSSVKVYRIEEPVVSTTPLTSPVELTGVETIELTYPGSQGGRDAEGLIVDSVTGDMFIISKRESLSRIYMASAPFSTTTSTVLSNLGALHSTFASAADISPDGTEILIRFNTEVAATESIFYYTRELGQSVADALLAGGVEVPYIIEPNGEAVAWGVNDSGEATGYFTISEVVGGSPVNLYYYDRNTDPMQSLEFAIVGDFGQDGPNEAAVASLISDWDPDIVLTVGDNNYNTGSAATIDANIGKHYQEFIGNYQGFFGPGSEENRFFPALGNHDWDTPNAQPHLDYFDLPGNERYYDFVRGPIHFFAVDTDPREPDGITSGFSTRAMATATIGWLDGSFSICLPSSSSLLIRIAWR